MEIWFLKPYSFEKDIGKAFNYVCSRVPDGDYICLLDGDCMFLRSDYGHIIRRYIEQYPNCNLFVPVCSRVGKGSQCYKGKRSENPDIKHHKRLADRLAEKGGVKNMNQVKWPSMPCFVFPKSVWEAVGGFDETKRILGVDVRFSKKVMETLDGDCLRMNGLYLLHYYRLIEGYRSRSHIR